MGHGFDAVAHAFGVVEPGAGVLEPALGGRVLSAPDHRALDRRPGLQGARLRLVDRQRPPHLRQRTSARLAQAAFLQFLLGRAVDLRHFVGAVDARQILAHGVVARTQAARHRCDLARAMQRGIVIAGAAKRLAALGQQAREGAIQSFASAGMIGFLVEHGLVQGDRRVRPGVQVAGFERPFRALQRRVQRVLVLTQVDPGGAPGQAAGQAVIATDGHATVAADFRGPGIRPGRRLVLARAARGQQQRQRGSDSGAAQPGGAPEWRSAISHR